MTRLGWSIFASRCSLTGKTGVRDSLAGTAIECVCGCFSFIQAFLFHTDVQEVMETMKGSFNKVPHFHMEVLNTSAFSPRKGKMLKCWQVQCGCTCLFLTERATGDHGVALLALT